MKNVATETKQAPLIVGAWYSYTPKDRHCREGLAEAYQYEEGHVVLLDNFWGSGRNRLTADEASTAVLYFNPHEGEWAEINGKGFPSHYYADEDYYVITSQHRLNSTVYLRVGAEPKLEAIIAEADEAVRSAKRSLDYAKSHRDSIKREYDSGLYHYFKK